MVKNKGKLSIKMLRSTGKDINRMAKGTAKNTVSNLHIKDKRKPSKLKLGMKLKY